MFFWNKNKALGKVNHYFDKIQVAVVVLSGKIKVGDKIKFKRGDDEFEEVIESMQIDHKEVQSAGKGEEVAIKVSKPAKAGSVVCKA
ncbi:MAG: translation elongation factor-like protein [Patescibacteria group bacterium]